MKFAKPKKKASTFKLINKIIFILSGVALVVMSFILYQAVSKVFVTN